MSHLGLRLHIVCGLYDVLCSTRMAHAFESLSENKSSGTHEPYEYLLAPLEVK
jgi:hypothetical protein